jgi:hypothetical protein
MHKSRIWIASIAAFGLVTPLLPWVNILGLLGVSGTEVAQGWLVFLLFAVAIVLAVTGSRPYPIDGGRRGGIAILGLAAAGFGIWKMIEIKDGTVDLGAKFNAELKAAGDSGGEALGRGMLQMLGGSDQLVEMAFGVYLVVAVGAALAIAALVTKRA